MLSTVINQVNRANQSAVTTAVFSPDGALLATGGDSLQLWNVGGTSQPGAPDFGLGSRRIRRWGRPPRWRCHPTALI
ncbi:hypothetical protein ACRAWF_07720 [Streptomyces sp. L7]